MTRHDDSGVCGVIILAAGMGRRMRSSIPKVLHEIGGKPLLFHILYQIREIIPNVPVAIVVGHGRGNVESYVQQEPNLKGMNISFVVQPEQLGTGHATRCAMDSKWGEALVQSKTPILVLPGDLPLIPSPLIQEMISPLRKTEVLRLLTCELSDPTGYGRIVRRGKGGPVIRIVEEKDATVKEKAIPEVGTSIYLFRADFLKSSLKRLSNQNAQGEYYLTDTIALATRAQKKTGVLLWKNPDDLRGVNDPWEMASASKLLNQRWIRYWSLRGVKFMDPWSTWLDVTVQLAEEVTVYPGVILKGATRIEKGAILGPGVFLNDMVVGEGAHLKAGTIGESSKVEARSTVGPYAHLRPGSTVGPRAKIGNFVELKKTVVGENTSIAHLSYLGDAEVGRNVNIGCGFVTCNFDGRTIRGERKHRTVIEDDVFLGSDCQTVAPVKVGKGAFVASGSTITQDVEPDALAIARSRQVNKPGYAKKLRQSKEE